jgi:predicted transcriptional regulator
MSDTERVRVWRERLKESGLVPMTIWVSAETKARYEDLALSQRRSPSELAHTALAAYRPGTPLRTETETCTVSDTVTDTEQLRVLLREELAQALAPVTDTVTATVTDTVTATEQLRRQIRDELAQCLEGLKASVTDTVTETIRAALDTERLPVSDSSGPAPVTDTVSAMVTAPRTETRTPTVSGCVTDTVSDTVAVTAATRYDPDAAFARMHALKAQGLSLAQIAAQLTAEGVRTHHGQPWHKSSVAYLLKTYGR